MKFKKISVFVALLAAMGQMVQAQDRIVQVADFGAVPNDGKCDIAAIKRALNYVQTVKAEELVFEAGTYDLFVGNAGRNIAIDVQAFEDFSMTGATDDKGQPATTFLRHYEFRNAMGARPILNVVNSVNFQLKNVIFDNNPRYSTAGEVIANDGKTVKVKIFEGNPVIDKTLFFTSNIWDLSTKTLKKVESPTYGGDVYKKREEYTWHVVGDPAERIMQLNSPTLASKVSVGEGLSWHFSFGGRQVVFDSCKDLFVENIWTHNAIGFCMEAKMCENITARRVKVIAPDNQLVVSSRDGWKLAACRGTVVMDEMHIEGVRWDGQNVHGSFMWPHQFIDKHTVWLAKRKWAAFPIHEDSKVGFWDGKEEVMRTVKHAELKKTKDDILGAVITFTEPIPDFVNEETLCQIYAWNIDSYTLSNSTFRNIAGSASLIRNTNVNIINNTFDHIMYPAIMIGGAIHEGEGVVPKNVRIEGNRITNSGWMPRHAITSGIGIRNQEQGEGLVFHSDRAFRQLERKSPPMTGIQVIGNTIEHSKEGLVAKGTYGMHVEGNTFIEVEKPMDIPKEDNPEVMLKENKIK